MTPLRRRDTHAIPCATAAATRGQAMVEFAFTSLILITLLVGMIDLGRAVFARAALANAVREAARYGAIKPDDTAGIVETAQARTAALRLSSANFTASTTNDQIACSTRTRNGAGQIVWASRACSSAGPRDRISVCATYPFVMIATRPFGLSAITMRECTVAGIQ